jgi:tetratricopeptide (TPR) repeat protein
MEGNMGPLEQKFLDALEMAKQDRAKGLALFQEVLDSDPKGDLADDALYNIGYLHFAESRFAEAQAAFDRLIKEHPDSTIAEFAGSIEHGKTPAKAWYMLVNCCLAAGKETEAWEACDQLAPYTDSYVEFADSRGVIFRKTYQMLARELLDRYASTKTEMEQMA